MQPAPGLLLIKSPCTEKCSIADHKLLTGGGLLLMADISPDMSASILAGWAWLFLTWSAFHGIYPILGQ